MTYAVDAFPIPTIPVTNADSVFPVRRIYAVGRNYADHIKETAKEPIAQRILGKFRNNNIGAICFVRPFKARGKINVVSHDCIVKTLVASKITHTHYAAVNANADINKREFSFFPAWL